MFETIRHMFYVVAISALGLFHIGHAIEPPISQVKLYEDSVVRVMAPERDTWGWEGHGTGVWIAPRLILTNCHVVKGDLDEVSWPIVDHDRSVKFTGTREACDVTKDLALVRTNYPNPDFIPITIGDSAVGDKIHSAGFGMGRILSMKQGVVGYDIEDPNRASQFMTNFSAIPGDSGSPVYNEDNNLVGLISTTLVPRTRTMAGPISLGVYPGTAGAIYSYNIRTFLEEYGYAEEVGLEPTTFWEE